MKAMLLPLAFLAALASRVPAAEPPAPREPEGGKADPSDLAASLTRFKREVKDSSAELERQLKTAKTTKDQQQVWNDHRARRDAVVTRAVELARKHPEDPAAFAILQWVIAGGIGWGRPTDAAFDVLKADYLASDKLESACQVAALYNASDSAERFLHAVLDKSPHRSLRGVACLSLGRRLRYSANEARNEKRPDADRLQKECEHYYERAAKEFGDVKTKDRSIGERAEAALFEMRQLVVGKPAPEILGEDIDGKPFKLSDYKGKVVVLDFWGNW